MRAGAIEPEGDRRWSHCGGSATWTDCGKSRGGRPARISVASSAKRSSNSATRGGTVRVGRRRRRRTAMTQPVWNRGDGQPDRRRLDEALDRILEHCRPVEVILFGSAARGECRTAVTSTCSSYWLTVTPPSRSGCTSTSAKPSAASRGLTSRSRSRRKSGRLPAPGQRPALRVRGRILLYHRGWRQAYAPVHGLRQPLVSAARTAVRAGRRPTGCGSEHAKSWVSPSSVAIALSLDSSRPSILGCRHSSRNVARMWSRIGPRSGVPQPERPEDRRHAASAAAAELEDRGRATRVPFEFPRLGG